MENQDKKFSLSSILIALAFIIASVILAIGMGNIRDKGATITVKGYAEKNIKSDAAYWTIWVGSKSNSMSEAYNQMKIMKDKVWNFLVKEGYPDSALKEGNIENLPVYGLNPQGYQTNDIVAYNVQISITVSSNDVYKIENSSKKIYELLNEGVNLNSNPPQYYVSNIDKYKLNMLSLALADAKMRANEIAKGTGNNTKQLKYARQGIFQITAPNSNEVADWGIYDTQTIDKTIKLAVDATYYIK
ncbi:MAG TPA: SIMPL domain-containing protein [Bacteroidota bacterium]|nr:SIMPL domain-containing protein [Candidatus Kapabacteria bacterium]HRS02447.1 SIMPL domain-containing protein [Bacteroidota bacterium]